MRNLLTRFRPLFLAICLLLPAFHAFSSAATTQEVYKTAGNVNLAIHVDTPDDWKPADKRPAQVLFFGGSWKTGGPDGLKAQSDYFNKRGMVCLRPNYRVGSRHNVTPDKCVEDAISAVRWVRANAARLGIDPDRIVVSGLSSGGHLAACTFFTTAISASTDDKTVSHLPNAMVLYFAPLDLYARYDLPGPAPFPGMSASTAKKISPLQLMRKGIPPTLVVCGTQDGNLRHNREFVDRGRKLGAKVEGFWAEGQPHSFLGRDDWFEKVMAKVDAFLVGAGFLAPMPADAPVKAEKGAKAGKKGAGKKSGGKK